jgi:pimeloyl-ACP methyl ester carboxylesterase
LRDTGGTGIPIVFLHAQTGTSDSWENQLEFFAGAGYRAIAYDRRGSGRSVVIDDGTPQPGSMTEDLESLVSHLDLPPFHLVAVAGGAFGALDYAAWKPERLRSAVAAATAGPLAEPEIRQFFSRIMDPELRGSGTSAAFLELSAGYRGSDPLGTQRWIEIEEKAHERGERGQPLREATNYERLQTIVTPVLALGGDADLVAPPAVMRLWSAQIPGVEFDSIPEVGHSPAWEDPVGFNSRVLAFIRTYDGRHGF